MKTNTPATAPVATIQTQSAQNLPDLVNALIEACGLLPNKMDLQIQFIVNSTIVSGSNNANLANRYGHA